MQWTEQEINVLRDVDLTHIELQKLLPHRSINSIRRKSYQFDLQRSMRSSGRMPTEEAQHIWDNPEFQQIIEGHLLGDGCIDSKGWTFRLSSSKKEYACFVQGQLNALSGKNNSGSYYPPVTKTWKTGEFVSKECWHSVCCCKEIFLRQRQLWYPEGKKIVPKDLVLTPLVCNRWYCDDGYLHCHKKSSNYRIELCTDSFGKEDIERLREQFIANGINMKLFIHKQGIRLATVIRENADKFLNYIGSPPVSVFAYKWGSK